AVRDGHRLIGVVMGGQSAGWRDRQMAALLDQGFADIGNGQAPSRPVMASVQPSASSHSAQPQAPGYATSPSAAPAAASAAPQQRNPAPVVASMPPQGDTATVPGRSGMIDNALRHLS